MPALLLVDARAQAQGVGHGRGVLHGGGGQVECLEAGPQQHQFALAEVLAVGLGLGHIVADGRRIRKAAQLDGHGRQRVGHGLAVQARRAQDARLDAELGLGRQQRLQARVLVAGGGADDLGVLVGAAFGLGGAFAIGHAHDDQHRAALLLDGVQRQGQRALGAGLADGRIDLGDQHRTVQRESGRIGVAGSGHEADHGRGHNADGIDAFAHFRDANAMMERGCRHGVLRVGGWLGRGAVVRKGWSRLFVGLYGAVQDFLGTPRGDESEGLELAQAVGQFGVVKIELPRLLDVLEQ